MVKCVAHRGWSGKAPENTMAAFEIALNEPKIDGIELDVHLSKDGVPVVIHDHTVDRTTNGEGAVKNFTAEELKELDAGSWYHDSFAGEKIPFLEEVLQQVQGSNKQITIEIKQRRNMYKGLEEKLIHMLREYHVLDQVLIGSFDHTSVKKINQIEPSVDTGLIFMSHPTLLLKQLSHTGANHVMMHHEMVTKKLVEFIQNNNYSIGVWTVDKPAGVRRIYDIDPELPITTNRPDVLFQTIDAAVETSS
ncbi:glycerophosphodiester phosphodiesterase [Salibacterium salarium]|uniref:Glycerophosphodiester phosphodiesterase n=1 Tax=Salibacterium salarium TaxID=284579 RepID=A0A428MWU1_9BACI|nr:glycerophosphodiester phosphodiesterase family protein [Salibacterium salarium]RSL30630.1 glycerophosphodiester phosphodiesterase [Salibacterium salarium]